MSDTPSKDQIADELSGWPIGTGYYQTQVGYDEAREMADAIINLMTDEKVNNPLQEWLDEGDRLCHKALPGPWGCQWNGNQEGEIFRDADTVLKATDVRAHDIHFIADARTRLPMALRALRAVANRHVPIKNELGSPSCKGCGFIWPCIDLRDILEILGEGGNDV